jgi:hypothetical protein
MDGYKAYRELQGLGVEVRFGPSIRPSERKNILGHVTHPRVAIKALRPGPGANMVTITDVSCPGRDIC